MRAGGHEYPGGQPGEPGGKRPESGAGGEICPSDAEGGRAMPEDAGAMPPATSPEGGGGGGMIGRSLTSEPAGGRGRTAKWSPDAAGTHVVDDDDACPVNPMPAFTPFSACDQSGVWRRSCPCSWPRGLPCIHPCFVNCATAQSPKKLAVLGVRGQRVHCRMLLLEQARKHRSKVDLFGRHVF